MRPGNPNTKSTGRTGKLNPSSSARPSWTVRTVSQSPEPPRQVDLPRPNLAARADRAYRQPASMQPGG